MKNKLQKELKPIEALEIMLLQQELNPIQISKREFKVEYRGVVAEIRLTDDYYFIISCKNISRRWHFKNLEELEKLVKLNFKKPH